MEHLAGTAADRDATITPYGACERVPAPAVACVWPGTHGSAAHTTGPLAVSTTSLDTLTTTITGFMGAYGP
jgi:hypothetical protein